MKTAVFYDLENMGLASKNGEFEQHFLQLQELLKTSELVGDLVLQRAYMRDTHHAFSQIAPILEQHKINLISVEAMTSTPKKWKNLVDLKMGVDATAVISKKRSIQTVVVASGDSDFGFLCQQIKALEKQLVVVSRFPTTGSVLLQICDDWLPLDGQALPPNAMLKLIEARIQSNYAGEAFFPAFEHFLGELENDLLIRHHLRMFGLPVQKLFAALTGRNLSFPNCQKLGFPNEISFITHLLRGTRFEVTASMVRYHDNKAGLPQTQLLEHILDVPAGYSREKLFSYYDAIKELENIDELLLYIHFMRRSGMLQENTLCPKRTFRSTIRKHLHMALGEYGVAPNETAIAAVEKQL